MGVSHTVAAVHPHINLPLGGVHEGLDHLGDVPRREADLEPLQILPRHRRTRARKRRVRRQTPSERHYSDSDADEARAGWLEGLVADDDLAQVPKVIFEVPLQLLWPPRRRCQGLKSSRKTTGVCAQEGAAKQHGEAGMLHHT